MAKRVVVTGIGMLTSVGNSVAESWQNLLAGKSGVDFLTGFDTTDFDTHFGAEVKDFKPENFGIDRKEARHMDRYTQLAVAATREAIEDAKLKITPENRERVGVIIGSGIGGITTLSNQFQVLHDKGPQRISPFLIPMMIPNLASGQVAIQFGARGTNFAVVSACSTGAHAIGEGAEIIKRGEADVMIVGGSEAPLVPIAVAGFNSMHALSTYNENPAKASRPFDKTRDGFVMGEGSGVLIIEDLEHAQARGAHIYAEVSGYGSTDDAHHMVQPEETGEGATRAMKLAISRAGITPQDLDYINAHGTSTQLNDKAETLAMRKALGDMAYEVSISSTKSMIGHLLGAAGAVEAIICVKTIQDSMIPPTINYEHQDPECDLDITPNVAKKRKVRHAMSNSFGFGGHNVSLILSQFGE